MVIDYPLYIEVEKLREFEDILSEQGFILKSVKFHLKNGVTVVTCMDPWEEFIIQGFSFDSILDRLPLIYEQARDWEEGLLYMTNYENMRWWGCPQ